MASRDVVKVVSLFGRQFSSWSSYRWSVGHVSRGEQKAQTASQQSPGTASACEGLIELGSCSRVPRNNGVKADRVFSRTPRGNDNRHLVL